MAAYVYSTDLLVSDQGAHFINKLMSNMAEVHNIQHLPTVYYSPWVNGTVERLNRDILVAFQTVLGELNQSPQDWPSAIDIIPTLLNEAPESRLGRNEDGYTRYALQVITGIRPRRPLLQVIPQSDEPLAPCKMDWAVSELLCKIKDLQQGFRELRTDVNTRIDARRQRAIDAHNAATNIIAPHSEVGEFVIICKLTPPTHKLSFRWCGPRRVVAVKIPAVCVVEDLFTQKRETVHATRMKRYCGKLDGTEVPDEVLDLADRTSAKYEVVESIVDIQKTDDGILLRVQWEGRPEESDYTWDQLSDIYDDIPDMVKRFLENTPKEE